MTIETYAQWQNNQPVNERQKHLIHLPLTNHQAHRMTPEQLAQVGWYRVLRIELGEGERLDNAGWAMVANEIHQTGTVIDAETVAAEKAFAEEHAFMRDVHEHGLSVIALGAVLGVFGLSFPAQASEVDKDIKRKLATGQLTPEQVPFVSVLSIAYNDLRSVGDERIVQIATYLQDNPQVAAALMEGEPEGEE